MRGLGGEAAVGSEGRAVNSIFAFRTRMTVLPSLSTAAGEKRKKRGRVRVTCVARRDFARDNKIYLSDAGPRGRDEDNCKFASPDSRLRFAKREIAGQLSITRSFATRLYTGRPPSSVYMTFFMLSELNYIIATTLCNGKVDSNQRCT